MAAAALAAGCTQEDAPCGPCDVVAGHWAVKADAPAIPCGGPALPETLEIGQVAATLTVAVDGGTLSGTLYESRRFSLHGSLGAGTPPDSAQLRALYVPGLADGGEAALVEASWTWTSAATGCSETRRFTAQRQ